MKLKYKKAPMYGEKRTKARFLWLPKWFYYHDKFLWLVKATWEEEYKQGIRNDSWEPIGDPENKIRGVKELTDAVNKENVKQYETMCEKILAWQDIDPDDKLKLLEIVAEHYNP